MKRICLSILLCLLLALTAAACAEAVLPADLQSALPACTVLQACEQPGDGAPGQWFILARTTYGSNMLLCYQWRNDRWSQRFRTEDAVPQGSLPLWLSVGDGFEDWASGKYYAGPILGIGQMDAENEQLMLYTGYQLDSAGRWMLVRVWSYLDWDSMDVGSGYIRYYKTLESGEVAATVHGTFQRDVRYLSLSAIPRNISEARQKLTVAPAIPASAELSAQEISFTGGQRWEVYSAPDAGSLRGAGGKAAVSTNGWIQVFGQEKGYILIQYSIDRDHYRFGYIDAAALPKRVEVNELSLRADSAVTVADTKVTDDPLFSQAALTTLPAGTRVTWLATLQTWAYIEGSGFRGFVPITALKAEPAHSFSAYQDAEGHVYDLFEIIRLHTDENHRVQAVTGRYERVVEDAEGMAGGEYALDGELFTWALAPDFQARMDDELLAEDAPRPVVTDLYRWYIDAYLQGREPAGELIYQADIPAGDETTQPDFWFITTRISLNEQNEINYMEGVYVPWG